MTPVFLQRARRAQLRAAAQFVAGFIGMAALLFVLALWAFWIAS